MEENTSGCRKFHGLPSYSIIQVCIWFWTFALHHFPSHLCVHVSCLHHKTQPIYECVSPVPFCRNGGDILVDYVQLEAVSTPILSLNITVKLHDHEMEPNSFYNNNFSHKCKCQLHQALISLSWTTDCLMPIFQLVGKFWVMGGCHEQSILSLSGCSLYSAL